jgi:aryl-alcohol dehydrogenase-like predicted oxidoreductase
MEKITINNGKITASRICLGTWAIGGWMWGGTDVQESINTVLQALEQGINMIDTAPIDGFGKSEEIVGKALRQYGHREKVVLATKVGLQWTKDSKVSRNSSHQRILQEIEDSLERLQTDYIDLYQVHWPDLSIPLAEPARTLNTLLESGKIRAVGVSNFSVPQMQEFLQYCPIHTSQPPYNLFERGIEKDILPFTEKSDMVTLAYGPLCRGLLSGTMTEETKFKSDDLRAVDPKFQSPHFKEYLAAVAALDDYAKKKYQKNVLALAIRWVLDRGHTIALWGARHPEQLRNINECLGWSLDAEDMQEIDKILKLYIKKPLGPEFMAPPA